MLYLFERICHIFSTCREAEREIILENKAKNELKLQGALQILRTENNILEQNLNNFKVFYADSDATIKTLTDERNQAIQEVF